MPKYIQMEFDYEKFLERLQKKNLTPEETAQEVYQEIRDAENQKAGFLDQATENPDFYTYVGSQVDSYITYLQVLHSQVAPLGQETPEQELYRPDTKILNQTMELVQYLEKVEQEKLGNRSDTTQKTNMNTTSADL